ncbi:c-type cytochrome [Dyadobacter sandarakinus]|uniref:C-type cytochrome n=1 Tax=Dyadobacter sandarakinus TaxID=2747268 RepID=A0ABX7I2C7_9BACT|nr:c-type cytochrome [Dyadobacter sandarakinus]QRR00204.1 c-type cytochrome [Dyadobacter sandarakinus]
MKALKIIGKILAVLVVVIAAGITYVTTALPNTGAAPDLKIDRTAARIERGEYLANHVTVCMDCHSTRDWSQYAGPVSGALGGGGEEFTQEMGFPGKFYAPNITPYALAGWTDGEIFRAVTTGVNKSGKALFPVMGYHRFGQLDKEDIYSVIAYIRTLPPVQTNVPKSEPDFPVSILINAMPQEASFTNRPPETDQVAYGKYLITATGCVDCHSKTDKGSVIPGTEFGGGMEFRSPNGVLCSANITMHKKTGIGNWTQEAFVAHFKAYTDSSYVSSKVAPGEQNTPMPWTMYSGMKEQDLAAIFAYLNTVKPIDHEVVKFD